MGKRRKYRQCHHPELGRIRLTWHALQRIEERIFPGDPEEPYSHRVARARDLAFDCLPKAKWVKWYQKKRGKTAVPGPLSPAIGLPCAAGGTWVFLCQPMDGGLSVVTLIHTEAFLEQPHANKLHREKRIRGAVGDFQRRRKRYRRK